MCGVASSAHGDSAQPAEMTCSRTCHFELFVRVHLQHGFLPPSPPPPPPPPPPLPPAPGLSLARGGDKAFGPWWNGTAASRDTSAYGHNSRCGFCRSCSLNLGVRSRYLAWKQCLDRGDSISYGIVVALFCALDCGLPCRWRHLLPHVLHAPRLLHRHSVHRVVHRDAQAQQHRRADSRYQV